jgi:dihydrofolate reductase
MPRLIVFNNVTMDGYFVSADGDMSWAHKNDDEWNAFTEENATGDGALVLGRVTYDLMVSFWPTPIAAEMMPVVAERMNSLPKIVFSRTMDEASWRNTRLLKGDLVTEVRELKDGDGPDMTILGSGTIVAQLAEAGLIDEYQIIVSPVVLGAGRTMFAGVPERLNFRLTKTRAFGNGSVLLCYEPAA